MEYQEFLDGLIADLPSILTGRWEAAEITREEVPKPQGLSYEGLCIRPKGESIGISLDMTSYFSEYQAGCSYEDILSLILDRIQIAEGHMPDNALLLVTDYEAARDYLAVQLVGKESNQMILKNIPHTDLEDMAAIYRIEFKSEANQSYSILVDNRLLERYRISRK